MNTAGTGTRPRYGVLDVVALLLREWLVMGAIFLAICAIGLGATFLLKKSYTAAASLFVGVGQEYVYQARVGTPQPSIPPSAAEVAQSEAAILNSLEVKQRVVRAMGIESFQDKPVANPTAEDEAKAVKAMTSALSVDITPLSPVISLSYKSDDPRRSAQVLNTVIDQYLTYRREVFQDRATPAIRSRREAFEEELETADRAYEEFLRGHQIGDFATARATLAASYQTIFTERLAIQAQLNQTAQRLTTLSNQLSNMEREIPLQQDLNVSAQDQILQLRTQREQLLSRYQADAAPVQEIEAQIRRLQSYVETGTAVGAKEVRVGPNPVWVQLEAQRVTTAAERDSLGARLAVLDRQLAEINQRQARLNDLESRNSTLSGNREVLSQSVREFQLREAQSRADNELVTAGADNVTVIERAQPPAEGKSLKLPLLALVILFAGFTALSVGLLRVFLRRGVWTPSSAERTFGVPVLAVAPAK